MNFILRNIRRTELTRFYALTPAKIVKKDGVTFGIIKDGARNYSVTEYSTGLLCSGSYNARRDAQYYLDVTIYDKMHQIKTALNNPNIKIPKEIMKSFETETARAIKNLKTDFNSFERDFLNFYLLYMGYGTNVSIYNTVEFSSIKNVYKNYFYYTVCAYLLKEDSVVIEIIQDATIKAINELNMLKNQHYL